MLEPRFMAERSNGSETGKRILEKRVCMAFGFAVEPFQLPRRTDEVSPDP
jgi:hypothetical protein